MLLFKINSKLRYKNKYERLIKLIFKQPLLKSSSKIARAVKNEIKFIKIIFNNENLQGSLYPLLLLGLRENPKKGFNMIITIIVKMQINISLTVW